MASYPRLMRASIVLALFVAAACGDARTRASDVAAPSATASDGISMPIPGDTPAGTAEREPSFTYVDAGGTLWLVDAETLEKRALASGVDVFMYSGAWWSADGRYLAYRTGAGASATGGTPGPDDGQLIVLDVDAGTTALIEDQIIGEPMWSPDSRRIAYARGEHGTDEWIAAVDGTDRRSLGAYTYIQYSPDGSQLLVMLLVDPSNGHSFKLMDTASGDLRDLGLPPIRSYPMWSPDGRYLAYWKDNVGGSAIIGNVVINDTTTGQTYDIGWYTDDETPQWAPAKDRYVFHNLELDPATGEIRELFPRPGGLETPGLNPAPGAVIAWSPDMRYVAIVEGRGFGAGPRSLVVLEPSSGARTTVNTSNEDIAHVGAPGYFGSWSPDGRYFAFGAISGEGPMSWAVFDAEMMVTRPVDVASVSAASFSPDGSWLLLQGQTGDVDAGFTPVLYVANADGSAPRAVPETSPPSTYPSNGATWRP